TTADSTLTLQRMQPSSDTRRAKRIQVYPAIYQSNTTLHVDYIREVVGMADDTDEPLMPIGDRTILLYGGLNRAWSRERNPEEATRNQGLFAAKLTRMAGKMDDSIDQPRLVPSKIYLGSKRMAQRQKDTRNGLPEGWGGGNTGGSVVTGIPNRVPIYDATGSLTASSITTTELGFLSTVNSALDGVSDVATLTNKTMDGTRNTFLNIQNSSLLNGSNYFYADGSRPMTGTLTVNGGITASSAISASNLSGSNSGDLILLPFGGAPNSSGASVFSQQLTLLPADNTNPGLISSSAQTIGGAKTFTSTISASNLSGSNTGDLILLPFGGQPNSSGATLTSQQLTLLPADNTNPGFISSSAQTIGGAKTFTSFTTFSSSAQAGQLTLQPTTTANDAGGIRFLNPAASGNKNFYIGATHASTNVLEITPSTANDGTTFSTPVLKVAASGTVTANVNVSATSISTGS